jgi:AhpD family alkylhydroperoxidase
MGSYFVDLRPHANGAHLVHDRTRCPPDCFPAPVHAEYLGELLDGGQAVVLARVRYANVNGCLWCTTEAHELEAHAAGAWPAAHGADGHPRFRLAPHGG